MKKLILMAATALFCAIPAMQAQKINKDAFISKLEKSNETIANPKKASKSKTWLDRGNLYLEAAQEPTKNVFAGMDMAMVKLSVGNPKSEESVTIDKTDFKVLVYPYIKIYFKDNKVASWKQTKAIQKGLTDVAIKAYKKAVELDPDAKEKAKEGLQRVSDFESQIGDVSIDIGERKIGAAAFAQAYKAQDNAIYGEADATFLYYAGYLLTMDANDNPKSYKGAEKLLRKAIKLGFSDEKGTIYYYLFHCLYGQKDADKANIIKAKDVLLEGISKFPKNELILDGLMNLYTSEEGVGDPADLITLIDNAIADAPDNVDLWFGRGRIFYALKNYDESIKSFLKVTELKPDLFEGNYYLGLFYAVKGDAANIEFNDKQFTNQAEYNKALKEINEIYMMAIPWYIKAHAIKPEDISTLEQLKSISFRLRDEDNMTELHNKYKALYEKANSAQ